MRLRIAIVLAALATPALAQTLNVTGTVSNPNSSAPFSVTVSQQSSAPGALFPAMGSQPSSVYPWAQYPPGVTLNGGIPLRPTQCGATVRPRGGGMSDTANIRQAVNNCTAGQHVQLSAGVFIVDSTNPVLILKNNITLRGVGPGPGGVIPQASSSIPNPVCAASTCTILYRPDWATTQISNNIVAVGGGGDFFSNGGTAIALASDAAQGAMSVTLASAPTGPNWAVGNLVVTSVLTCDPNATGPNWPIPNLNNWPNTTNPEIRCDAIAHEAIVNNDTGAWTWYGQKDRYLQQLSKIVSVSGNVVTFETPLANTFAVANGAQTKPWAIPITRGVGVEEMYLYGGTVGAGSVGLHLCDGCWIRHIESHFNLGGDTLGWCYKCEYRDSYIHESQQYRNTTNGGGGYLLNIDQSAHSLVENNIIWNGEKVDVMRNAGPGNVVAYNYMDDAFDAGTVVAQEDGVNDGHYAGSHFDLIEGNWAFKYSGDSWWGNSIYITAFRNWFTGMRGCRGWLATYTNDQGWPCGDYWYRTAVTLQAYQYWHNIVGNVIGFSGQAATLVKGPAKGSPFVSTQTGVRYESPLDGDVANSYLTMYEIGQGQDGGYALLGSGGDPALYQKTNRQGNFDWFTQSQIWYATYGGSGTTSTGSPQPIPTSLYLPGKPAFFGTNPWPWVDPSTGATSVLPAKARFDAGTPNQLSP